MIMLQCSECDSLNLSIDKESDISCVDCGFKTYREDFKLYLAKDENVIDLDNTYWISKDGKKHEFQHMTKDYLRNVIQMLRRNYPKEELMNSNLFKGLTQEYMLR